MTRAPLLAAAAACAAAAALIPQQATAANSCGVPFDGTTYLVSTPTHLRGLALLNCNKTYDIRVLADITLTPDVEELTPFGTLANPYTGTFDGGGHSITGMQVVNPTADGFGLFGHTQGATLRNVTISGTVIGIGLSNGGLLAGTMTNTTVSNVRVSGVVNGSNGMGGLAGSMSGGSISNSSASVVASATYVAGGLVAWADANGPGIAISNVRTDGSVSAGAFAGGVVGSAFGVSVNRASSTSLVQGETAGGVVGQAQDPSNVGAMISDSYSTGAVSATPASTGHIGGVLGSTCTFGPVALVRNYFAGTLAPAGSATSGGILGGSGPCVVSVGTHASNSGNLWNSDTTGPAGSGGTVGVGRTTAQMKQIGTYTALGWSIVNGWEPAGSSTWGICPQVNDGYPFLQSTGAGSACAAPPVPVSPAALRATVLPSRTWVETGQALRVGVRASNTGGSAATSVVSCVRLPANLVITRARGAARSGRTACFRVGTLAAGAAATRSVTVRAASVRRRAVTVTATAKASGLSRVNAAPVTVTVAPRAARARVTG